MYSENLHVISLNNCVDAITDDTATLYECIRLIENPFQFDGEDTVSILTLALKRVLAHDPYYLITSVEASIVGISERDIEDILQEWSVTDVEEASLLEGHLRMKAALALDRGEIDVNQVSKAVAALEGVKQRYQDDPCFLETYCRALDIVGDPRFNEVHTRLLAATDLEWRSSILKEGMAKAMSENDWSRFDELRVLWEQLPPNAHICECEVNYVANIDGLRAIHNGNIHEAIKCLHKAASVSGCAHLNSGSVCLLLAEKMIGSAQALDAVKIHLSKVAQFSPKNVDALGKLFSRISKLEAIT